MGKEATSQAMNPEKFEPKIIAFLCNWCSYAGADLAGVSRMQYPPSTRTVRVMCTGTISPHHILKAFQKGADGVIVAGCHIGDCHYLKGNYMTIKRVAILQELMKFTGLQEERLFLNWVSAAEGVRFAEMVRTFTDKIKELGPSHLKTSY